MSDGEYKKIEFPTAVDVRVTLKYNSPLEKQGNYGTYYTYACRDEGSVKPFFYASPELHKRIQEFGKKAGDTFIIKKMKRANPETGNDITVWELSNPEGGSGGGGSQQNSMPAGSTQQQSTGASRASHNVPFVDEKDISIKHQAMLKCASWIVASGNVQGYHSRFHVEGDSTKPFNPDLVAKETAEIAMALYWRHEYAVKKIISHMEKKDGEAEKKKREEEKLAEQQAEKEQDNFIGSEQGGGEDPFAALDDGSVPF